MTAAVWTLLLSSEKMLQGRHGYQGAAIFRSAAFEALKGKNKSLKNKKKKRRHVPSTSGDVLPGGRGRTLFMSGIYNSALSLSSRLCRAEFGDSWWQQLDVRPAPVTMTMKGLSSSRSHHHPVTCDPSYDSVTLGHSDRRPYFLSQGEVRPPDHSCFTQRNTFQTECNAYPDLASCTFPRRHYSSHHELKEECGALVPYTGPPGGSKAGGGGTNNRMSSNLLEQFERQPAGLRREGYHTLQYKRTALEHQRSDSPGRIRHLVHSVQKLFTKSHSLEGPSGAGGAAVGRLNGGKSSPDDPPSSSGTLKHSKRSKSKDRSKSEPKMRTAISGYWSSDDTLDRDVCLYHHHHGGSGRALPSGVMTMGRHPDKSQSQYFMESYNTISAHTLKTSRSNNDVKCSTCSGGGAGGGGVVLPLVSAVDTGQVQLKKSSWSSTLTVSRAREVYQKASVNLDKALDKALVKAEQGRTCHFLQVPASQLRLSHLPSHVFMLQLPLYFPVFPVFPV